MADDQDRVLAQLAVEAGFISREDAGHYWQRAQAAGSPRFVQLLMQERRLTGPQLEALKVRFYANQQLRSAASGRAPVVNISQEDAAATSLDGPRGGVSTAADTFIEAGASGSEAGVDTLIDGGTPVPGGGPEAAWEDALAKDTLLARILLQRRLVSNDMLLEARNLQLQRKMRLGVILVQKGYVQRGVVESAIQAVQTEMAKSGIADAATAAAAYQAAATQFDAGEPLASGQQATIFDGSPPLALPKIFDVPTILDGPRRAGFNPGSQEETPTVLNHKAIKGKAKDADPFANFLTGASLEELNPFGALGAKAKAKAKGKVTRATKIKQPIPSVDELDVFTEAPSLLAPNPAAIESKLDIPMPGAAPGDFAGHGSQPGPVVDAFAAAPPMGGVGRNSGYTQTGVPIGGEVDSGSTRMKAREKAQLKRATVKRKPLKKKDGNFPLLVLLMLIGGLAIAGGLYFLLDLMG